MATGAKAYTQTKSKRYRGRLTTISLIELAADLYLVQEHSHISGLVLMERMHSTYEGALRHYVNEREDIKSADALATAEA